MGIWDFIQNQILRMKWLNALIGNGLSAMGLDITTRLGGSVQFFLYDVIKITVLLCTLIFVISYKSGLGKTAQDHFYCYMVVSNSEWKPQMYFKSGGLPPFRILFQSPRVSDSSFVRWRVLWG